MSSGFQYIDGVGNVAVVNGMAHIDLVVVRPALSEGQQPRVEAVEHLVMTLPQFVRLCAEMSGHLKRMEEKGLITRKSADVSEGTLPSAAAQPQTLGPSQPVPDAPPQPAPKEEAKRRGFFGRG